MGEMRGRKADGEMQANYLQTLQQLLEATMNPDTNVIKAVSCTHGDVPCVCG
jgi:hypothetical protein